MRFFQSFRPTPHTMLVAGGITALATFVMIKALLCALNGSENCFALPLAAQFVLIFLLWPWAIVARFGGPDLLQITGIIGFLLSFLWVYGWVCVLRWIILFMRQRSKGSATE